MEKMTKESPASSPSYRADTGYACFNSDAQYDTNYMKVIKTPVAEDIRQLVISPHGNYMAILTTHTIHIALLPDYSHLTSADDAPLRLKIFTLGSITHVTSQSAIISALWHPLGVNGSCIVTVTEDAVVRVWELSPTDRWSFDRLTLAIDLQKLADGTALDQDFSASVNGSRKGFSPDSFEMEVAAASFGERSSGGWSSMTLWIAMREGDVYALCPLLPEKWVPPSTLVPSLSVSIVAKIATFEDDHSASDRIKQLAQQQLAWMGDLDNQTPTIIEPTAGYLPLEVYSRPSKPGRVPKLQGPFEFELAPEVSEDELDSLISDIYVIGGKVNAEELMSGEDDELELEEGDLEGLSLGIVCLLTSSGRVQICLDLDGVEAQWLPNSKSKVRRFAEVTEPPTLLTFQTMDTLHSHELYDESWPTFSSDVTSRYSFFITHASGVTFVSLSPWVFRLESELRNTSSSGADFRIDLLVKGQNSIRQRVISRSHNKSETPTALSESIVIRDPELGYFLLTSSPTRAVAVSFEIPEDYEELSRSRSPTYDVEPEPQPLLLCAPREIYYPASTFSTQSNLPALLEDLRRSKYKRMINESVKLSPATLTIMTDAHKVLSEETHRISTAAAELFRRCEKLQLELSDQIKRANEVAVRVEDVISNRDDADDSLPGGNEGLETRIQQANDRQKDLVERMENLKKKYAKGAHGRPLSDKEKMWFQEVTTLEENLLPKQGDSFSGDAKGSWRRFEDAKELMSELLEQVNALAPISKEGNDDSNNTVNVPSQVRKHKVAQVMKLLEREQALVEGTKNRLEKLTMS